MWVDRYNISVMLQEPSPVCWGHGLRSHSQRVDDDQGSRTRRSQHMLSADNGVVSETVIMPGRLDHLTAIEPLLVSKII